MQDTQLISALKSINTLYTHLSDSEKSLDFLKKIHKKEHLSAEKLQQDAARICRDLDTSLQAVMKDASESEQKKMLTIMVETIHSFQRYMIKEVYGDKSTQHMLG